MMQTEAKILAVDDSITKSFDSDELSEKVRVHLHSKNAEESNQIESQTP
ncbi:hypothetical protein ACFL5Z_04335 [Planctomycetota bacterium]